MGKQFAGFGLGDDETTRQARVEAITCGAGTCSGYGAGEVERQTPSIIQFKPRIGMLAWMVFS